MKLPKSKPIYNHTVSALGNIFASKEELDSCKSRFESDKRDSKIDYILNGVEYDIKSTLEKDPEYIKLKNKGVYPLSKPSGLLLYMEMYNNDIKDTDSGYKINKDDDNGYRYI
jgi:hypothetical protein